MAIRRAGVTDLTLYCSSYT